jgi:hypothetical protein
LKAYLVLTPCLSTLKGTMAVRDCVAITNDASAQCPPLAGDYVAITILSFRASEARRKAWPVLDTGESSIISNFWIPAFAGMTILKLFSPIATQSLHAEGDL